MDLTGRRLSSPAEAPESVGGSPSPWQDGMVEWLLMAQEPVSFKPGAFRLEFAVREPFHQLGKVLALIDRLIGKM